MKYQDYGPADRNRTCIPRLGGMCTIHCATASNAIQSVVFKSRTVPKRYWLMQP
jgi:hypothetical protein